MLQYIHHQKKIIGLTWMSGPHFFYQMLVTRNRGNNTKKAKAMFMRMYDQSLLVGEKPNGAAIFKKCSAEWLTEVSLSRVTKRNEELTGNPHHPDLETLVFENRALAKKVKELSYAQHKAPDQQYPGGPIKANMAELVDDNEGRNCVDCHKNFHCPKSRSERVTRCPACYESYRKSSEGAQALSRSWAAREANKKGTTAKSGANKSSRMYPATVSYPMVSEDEAAEHARRQQQTA